MTLFGLDAIQWAIVFKPDTSKGDYYDSSQGPPGFLEPRRISFDQWRIESEDVPKQAIKPRATGL